MIEDKGLKLIERMFDDSTPPDLETMAFIRGLMDESDRGCVLAGTAFLNDEVEALLRASFCESSDMLKKTVDPLFKGGNAPLGSFWAKIKLALALELITPSTHDILDRMRELRNEFAHKSSPVSLSDEKLGPILVKLEAHLQKVIKAFGLLVEEKLSVLGNNMAEARPLSRRKIEFVLAVGFCEADIHKGRRKAYKWRTARNCPIDKDAMA